MLTYHFYQHKRKLNAKTSYYKSKYFLCLKSRSIFYSKKKKRKTSYLNIFCVCKEFFPQKNTKLITSQKKNCYKSINQNTPLLLFFKKNEIK